MIADRSRLQKLPKSVPEDERVLAIVEPELELIEIAIKMLARDLVERTSHTTFEERPRSLNCVRVDLRAHPLVGGVDNRLMPAVRCRTYGRAGRSSASSI